MSFPYVLLAAQPVWLKFVPRPGPWMVTFERIMGFLLLATVVWLLNTVGAQLGAEGLVWTLVFLLFVAAAAWLYGKVEHGAPVERRLGYYGGAAGLLIAGWLLCFQVAVRIPELIAHRKEIRLAMDADWLDQFDQDADGDRAEPAGQPGAASVTSQRDANGVREKPRWEEIPWVNYTRERARTAVVKGRTVFIDYTAEWCLNCKTNEQTIIDTEPVRETMQRLGVVPFKADYTLYDPEIREDLLKYGSGGVPMYLVIPANQPDRVIRLDELNTQSAIISALEKAGPSTYRDGEGTAMAPPGGRSAS
jgi:thiol:disulfide interchange protein DsbD